LSRILDAEVREYLGLCESLAERYSRGARDEYDDLVQEGLIAVWRTLRSGKVPARANIENRMKNWLRYRGRQHRQAAGTYDKLLPLEENTTMEVPAHRLPQGHGPDEAQ
jgi:DNA-directed RNA polymerase specialized sigma24 family protein